MIENNANLQPKMIAAFSRLGGCAAQLARPDGAEGLEYSTLARALLRLGSPSVIATLWEVNDKASQNLMRSSIRILPTGMTASLALKGSASDASNNRQSP